MEIIICIIGLIIFIGFVGLVLAIAGSTLIELIKGKNPHSHLIIFSIIVLIITIITLTYK